MVYLTVLVSLGLAIFTNAFPTITPSKPSNSSRPLVIWHGLGDSHSSPGMVEFMSLIRDIHPGLFIHSVYVDKDLEKDQKAGYFGNADEQVDAVAEQLAAIPELSPHGFDAIGFSQGGQFLRAFTERHNKPPVHNLITFGSQHMGITDLPGCKPTDFLCQLFRSAARMGVYSSWAQSNLIPAQYYRDTTQLSNYLASNHFLTSINNEIPESRNQTYVQNFASLANLVLVLFTRDKTVVPKESAWFGSYAPSSDGEDGRSGDTLIPMKSQPLYLEDWIGLKQLDQAGRVKLESCEGEHMQLARECWVPIVNQYVGSSWESAGSSMRYNLVVQTP